MSILETHITNIIDGLFVFYLCSKFGVIKAFARKLFSYLLFVASSVFVITMLRKSFEKQQLAAITLLVLAILYVAFENKKEAVAVL